MIDEIVNIMDEEDIQSYIEENSFDKIKLNKSSKKMLIKSVVK